MLLLIKEMLVEVLFILKVSNFVNLVCLFRNWVVVKLLVGLDNNIFIGMLLVYLAFIILSVDCIIVNGFGFMLLSKCRK